MAVPVPSTSLAELDAMGIIKGVYFFTSGPDQHVYLTGSIKDCTGLWSNYSSHLESSVTVDIVYTIIAASQIILDDYAAEQLTLTDQDEFNRLTDLGHVYTG